MINRLIELSLETGSWSLPLRRPRRVGLVGAPRHADRRHSRSLRQPGHRLHRLAGHSPQEVEDQVTYPLTVNLQGLAGVRVVRSQSAFGFSMIYVDLRGRRRPVLRARARARADEPRHEAPARRRRRRRSAPTPPASATSSGTRSRARRTRCASCGVCRTGSSAISSTPFPASPRWRRSAGYVQQYQIDVDPNRLRSLRPAAQCGRGGRARQQPQRRRQRARVERRLADRARRRPDRVRRRHQADRRRRVERRAGVRRAGRRRADWRCLPGRVAGQGDAGGRRRRRRRAARASTPRR